MGSFGKYSFLCSAARVTRWERIERRCNVGRRDKSDEATQRRSDEGEGKSLRRGRGGSGRMAVDAGRCVRVAVRWLLNVASGMARTPGIRTCGVIGAGDCDQ